MTSIIFLVIFLCLPSFFKYVEYKWRKDNKIKKFFYLMGINLFILHLKKHQKYKMMVKKILKKRLKEGMKSDKHIKADTIFYGE